MNWRKKFDKEFPSNITAYINDKDEKLCAFVEAIDVRDIKTFIQNLLKEQEKEFKTLLDKIVEGLEHKRDLLHPHLGGTDIEIIVYHEKYKTIQEIINIIEEYDHSNKSN